MFRKIAGPFREFGLVTGALYAVDRVLGRIVRTWRLYPYDLMVQPIVPKRLMPAKFRTQFDIREIGAGDPLLDRMPVRPDVMASRLRQRATCLGAFKKGELVGYMWFCRDRYEEDEVRCTYVLARADESVFDFDFYLFPEHRLGMAFVALWDAANERLFQSGIRYTFSRLTRFNQASRRAHRHLGWKRIGSAMFLQLGRVEMMFATIAPFVRLSTSRSAPVRLRLAPDVLQS